MTCLKQQFSRCQRGVPYARGDLVPGTSGFPEGAYGSGTGLDVACFGHHIVARAVHAIIIGSNVERELVKLQPESNLRW